MSLVDENLNEPGSPSTAADERALEDPGGSVVAAARLFGVKHQTFGSILGARHRQGAGKGRPPQRRRKSIVKAFKARG